MYTHANRPVAAARMEGSALAPDLSGTVTFCPARGGVLVTASLFGLPRGGQGIFALHIHETGDCSGEGFPRTGGHYDPAEGEGRHPAHAGDLPPLFRSGDRAFLSVLTDRFRISDVVGRSVIVHSGPDDFTTQPSGNPGKKLACGVIRRI